MTRIGTQVLFVLTAGVSAATLFLLQPMCARMILPTLGGSTSVWTTCMLFFQAGLLGGYAYVHAIERVPVRVHAIVHVFLVLLAACFFLPPALTHGYVPGSQSPTAWLLATLALAIGAPYLLLASSAPLLQLWLARSGDGTPRDPYFLYAASNAGSLIGLLAYPFLLEPALTLHQQRYLWAACFSIFALLTLACAVIVWVQQSPAEEEPEAKPVPTPAKPPKRSKAKAPIVERIRLATLAKWLFLAFLPSSLMLSVTVHLTADVASLPFLWVVPLSLYLLTYVWAFSPGKSGTHPIWNRWLPVVVIATVLVLFTEATEPLPLVVGLHLLGLFWIGMVCHGELARSRPPISNLTGYYLCISVGGALGGLFNGVIAPAVFGSLVEYPAVLALACVVPAFAAPPAAKPSRKTKQSRPFVGDIGWPLLLGGVVWILAQTIDRTGITATRISVGLLFGVPLVVCYVFSRRPLRFALAIAVLLVIHGLHPGVHGNIERRIRSFFGIHRIARQGSDRVLIHGNTEHGRQSLERARRTEPLAYYTRSGPIGDLFAALPARDSRRQRVAVVGLGAGALAAYAQAGEHWTFYEIDPSVISLARDSGSFTYLSDATARGAKVQVIEGDGRFQLGRAAEKHSLIIIDAFGSDSIPTHLFTREALQVYRDRLTDNGLIAVHYSSRYFELRPILGALARSARPTMTALYREDLTLTGDDTQRGKAASNWAILFQSWHDPVMKTLKSQDWTPIGGEGNRRPWTDDYANPLGALRK